MDWIPIAPYLNAAGAFLSLSHLPNGNELKPVQLEAGQDPFGSFAQQGKSLSMNAAIQLGLAGIIDLSTSFSSFTLTYDTAFYAQAITTNPIGGAIYGTRWGAGARTRISVLNADAKLQLNSLPAIAAAATLGRVDAIYDIDGIGAFNAPVMADLPPPGRFDKSTLGTVLTAMKKIMEYVSANRSSIRPAPFMIIADPTALGDPFAVGRAHFYAMVSIQKGLSLDEAVAGGRTRSIDPLQIGNVYAQLMPGTATSAHPDGGAKARAQNWLAQAQLD